MTSDEADRYQRWADCCRRSAAAEIDVEGKAQWLAMASQYQHLARAYAAQPTSANPSWLSPLFQPLRTTG